MNDLIASLGVPEPCKTSLVDGVRLAYDDTETSAPAVVCLHAVGHGGGDFDFFRAGVAHRHRVIRLDWPSQGRSGPDHEPASAARYAELLASFLDSIGVQEAILFGNSIGGAAALQFAASHPARVRALVLANPGGLAPVDFFTGGVCRAMARFFRAGERGARWFAPAFRIYYGRVLRESEASDRRAQIVAAAYEIAPTLAEAWQSFSRPEADLRGLAPGIDCPVWLPWARDDQIIAFHRSRSAIETFPDATVRLFRGGHSAFLEDPEAFVDGFLRFTESIVRTS